MNIFNIMHKWRVKTGKYILNYYLTNQKKRKFQPQGG